MNRTLLILLMLSLAFTACKKSEIVNAATLKAQAAADDKVIKTFLSANGLTDSAKEIDTTGVYYIIRNKGTGISLYTNSTQITVGYSARYLPDDKLVIQTDSIHPYYTFSQIITGWQIGIPEINQGGEVRLFVPSRHAYGPYPQAQLGLPADAVLDFDIQLYDVTNN